TGLSVDNHGRAGRHAPADVVKPDDGGDPERAREDRRVIRAAARIRREPLDSRPVELRHDRRGQLVSDEDARRIEILQPVSCPALVVTQVHPQPAGDIVQVALAFVQARIVDAVEHSRRFVERPLHGPFRIDAFVAHHCCRAPDQNRVVEHEQLRVENRGQIGAASGRDATPDLFELAARSLTGALERRELTRHPVWPDGKAQHLCPLNRDQRRPYGDAGRYADAVQALHDSSPNPDSTSSASAATARSSSGPSAITVSVVPREAANNKMPMMLFPSMTFESRPTRIRDSNPAARCTNLAAARAWSPRCFTEGT